MNKIKELTESIRNYSECDLDFGTLKTLKMIDNESNLIQSKINEYKKLLFDIEKWSFDEAIEIPEKIYSVLVNLKKF